MKTVHFLTSRDQIPAYAMAPVRENRQKLRERGYGIKIFHRPTPACLNCDILCLVSKPLYGLIGEGLPVLQPDGPTVRFLKKARETANTIILMDDSDSTSVTHFELLPYVDLYLKKQLLADFGQYRRNLYGGRLFSDFYHQNFGIEDSRNYDQFYALPEDQEYKLSLSWNIGMADMYNAFTRRNRLHRWLPGLIGPDYNVRFTDPRHTRPVAVFLRTSANLKRETISFHRQEILRRLSEFLESNPKFSAMIGDDVFARSSDAARWLPQNGGGGDRKLSTRRYRDVVKRTKVLPSPFGWGELGVRDYEAFIFGTMLLKPDMSHMKTWPDIFIKNETCLTFKWDFSDLDDVLQTALEDDTLRIRIASAGQDAYRDSISKNGMERFCEHFARLMKQAADSDRKEQQSDKS